MVESAKPLSWHPVDRIKYQIPRRRVATHAYLEALVAQQAGQLVGGGAGHAARVASAVGREKD